MKVVFMGTPHAAVPTLRRIIDDGHDVVAVYTQPDRPSGRGRKIVFSPVKEFAMERGLQVLQPEKVRTDDALSTFRSHAADVAVVVAYGRILPIGFLEAFRFGAINVHFSLLPKYRGAAPVTWAVVNGEETTGVTTMKMDVGLDTGDILLQKETEIGSEETSIELMSRLSVIGADLLSETLHRYVEIAPKPQIHEMATLAPILRKEDGRIDWTQTSLNIERQVRGFQPFPTSFTFLNGARLTLWKGRTRLDLSADVRPGTVLSLANRELIVACGEGKAFEILELQLEGKKRSTAKDFLNGSVVREFDVLG